MSLGNPERPVGGLAVRAPAGVELRPLGRSDLAGAVRLARAQRALPERRGVSALAARFDALLDSVDVVPFLAVEGADPIGLGILHFRRRLNFPTFEGWISELYVVEGQRGRGVGRALLEALIAEWRLRGSHRLQANVPDGATAAEELFRAAGLEDWMLDFQLRPVVAPEVQPVAGLSIRPAAAGDFDAVTALLSQFGAARTPSADRIDAVRRTFATHLADVAGGRAHSMVALIDDGVVGACAVEWQRPFWTEEVHAWLPDLIVDAGQRGRGIGRGLLVDAIVRADAVGAAQLSLESGPGREAAHALYRSAGFTQSGHTWLLRRDPR
jgi:GNAT superfamily N-acetyltransferase